MVSTKAILLGGCAALALCAADVSAQATLDLADIVGNGNGTGNGLDNTGYNPRNGAPVAFPNGTSTDNPGTSNVYNVVTADPTGFIDGVFVPDGGLGSTQVTSTSISASLPDTSGNSWEPGIGSNAACCGSTITVNGSPVDFAGAGHSFIGFHANKGITFDLDAIRTANPGQTIERFTAVVGNVAGQGSSAFTVLLDGTTALGTTNVNGGANALAVDVPIGAQRFLTLVATDQGDYSFDSQIIGDPRLTLIPEPTALGLLGAGALLALGRRRRRA